MEESRQKKEERAPPPKKRKADDQSYEERLLALEEKKVRHLEEISGYLKKIAENGIYLRRSADASEYEGLMEEESGCTVLGQAFSTL